MGDRSYSEETSLVAKMLTVFDAAGLGNLIEKNDLVAIKLHPGEYNTTGNIRPQYIRALVDRIKELGGRPYVTETCTMPYGTYCSRVNALDLSQTAARNGITEAAIGCPFLVADGFFGTSDVHIDLPEGLILKEQYIAEAIARADVVIVLSHFKGHPMGSIGGAIKNIGIGAASKRGKHNTHLGGHPKYGFVNAPYDPSKCIGRECPKWQACEESCPYGLIKITETGIDWDQKACVGCLSHMLTVDCGAIGFPENIMEATNVAIADSALACVKSVKNKIGFVNLAIDISPWCDCIAFADRSLVPNIGVFASLDPVAIDKACLDKVSESPGTPGSAADEKDVMDAGLKGKFTHAASILETNEEIQMHAGAKNGLGSTDYELIEADPQPGENFRFQWDKRPVSVRMKRLFKEHIVYPPKGFDQVEDIDDVLAELQEE